MIFQMLVIIFIFLWFAVAEWSFVFAEIKYPYQYTHKLSLLWLPYDLLYSLQIITANLALFPEGGKNEANLYIHLNNSVCKFLIFLSGS